MSRHVCTIYTEAATRGVLLKNVFSCEITKIFTNTYFEEHLRTTATICNNIRKNKSGVSASFRYFLKIALGTRLKFDLNLKKTTWEKVRFQLTLNKSFSQSPLLIQGRLKHR